MKAQVKLTKKSRPVLVKNMSAKARAAAKAFKGLKLNKTPGKLEGTRAKAIKRAVRSYYIG
jgi:hypothetical protein